jgi:imidazolonepropionase-like amidohydrolase
MSTRRLVIRAARMLRGPAGERVTDAAVLLRDGVIVAAGGRAAVQAVTPPDTPVLDYPHSTLLPGLIDGHVHLSMDGGRDPVGTMLRSDAETLAAGMAERARRLLDCGVTTVRDLGDRDGGAVRLRNAIAAGELAGPRILAAVAPLTPPRGHCWFLGGEVDGKPAMREMVRRNAEAGADVIKVMASGGYITEGGAEMWESQFSAAQLAVIVDEARQVGLPVAAHAHGAEAIAFAVTAGVSTIEHCAWMVGDGAWAPRADVAHIATGMAAHGIAACCTVGSHDWSRMAEQAGEAAARAAYDRLCWMDRLGVPLVPGTDGGVQNAVFDEFAGALELYEWLGFPAERVIELATAGAAQALGLAATTGRIAPGLSADLLVVDGDPTRRLAALRAVRLVVARGRPYHMPATAAAVPHRPFRRSRAR